MTGIILLISLLLNAIIGAVAFVTHMRLKRVKNGYRYISRQLDILGAEYFSLNSSKAQPQQ
jgi:hypothetical protein